MVVINTDFTRGFSKAPLVRFVTDFVWSSAPHRLPRRYARLESHVPRSSPTTRDGVPDLNRRQEGRGELFAIADSPREVIKQDIFFARANLAAAAAAEDPRACAYMAGEGRTTVLGKEKTKMAPTFFLCSVPDFAKRAAAAAVMIKRAITLTPKQRNKEKEVNEKREIERRKGTPYSRRECAY